MKIKELVSEKKIAKAISVLASQINKDYKGKTPLLVGTLTGAFVFMADLVRVLKIPVECDFMKISSYGKKMHAGKIKRVLNCTIPVKGRDVLIIEDIVDTGASLKFIKKCLRSRRPKSLKTCVLMYKNSPRMKVPKSSIDYLGLEIPDVFVVGYGVDCAQRFRELKFIGKVLKD